MSSQPGGTPAAIVGLDLDGRGLDQANAALDRQLRGWDAIEARTMKVGAVLEGMTGRLAGGVRPRNVRFDPRG